MRRLAAFAGPRRVPCIPRPWSRRSPMNDDRIRAAVFRGPGAIRLEEKPMPIARPGEAILRVTLTTICGTDLHILRGEYPVKPGLVIGHEPVGVITELGPGVTGYAVG